MVSILEARRRLQGRIYRTPLVRSRWLSERTGADVWLKLECQQRTQSFKIRGALNAALACREEAPAPRELVTASSGNHGRALAEAAADAGMACVVFTPADAARAKLEAIRAAGARLEAASRDYDEAERTARDYAEAAGARFISPYNHPDVIAGGGTVGLEIVEDLPQLQTAVVGIGGGGLVSGVATALKTVSPGTRVVGVEAERNPVFATSRRHGRITRIDVADTIADAFGGNIEEGAITFEIVERLVDTLAVATETAIAEAITGFAGHERLVVEGGGAAGAAALVTGRIAVGAGERVVVVVSGASIDREKLARLLAGACG